MPTFFIHSTTIVDGDVVLMGDLFRHVSKSLRTRPGESLVFIDEQGTRYLTTVTKITKQVLHSRIESIETHPVQSVPSLVLGQALLKGDKMGWVIQKAAELGVSTIAPLMTDHVIPKIRSEQLIGLQDRWNRIGVEAAQQSERWPAPVVFPLQPFTTFLQTMPGDSLKILLAERLDEGALSEIPLPASPHTSIVLYVGPEGGWSQKELLAARDGQLVLASLGKGILRAETATLAAVAIIQTRLNAL